MTLRRVHQFRLGIVPSQIGKIFFQCMFDTPKYSGKRKTNSNKIKHEKNYEKQVSYVTRNTQLAKNLNPMYCISM